VKKKDQKPTDAELAAACGLKEEAYKSIKHLSMNELASVAALFGKTLIIVLTPRKKKRLK
jgi:hypothetical protein